MTRKKVKLAFITNDTARKATFQKRKKGLLKKLSELSILCGVDACSFIYSPYDNQPEVWPSPMEAQKVLNEFNKMPDMEQSKNMIDQESFLRKRISKAKHQLKKKRKDNKKKEATQVMFEGLSGMSLNNLNKDDLSDLGWTIDQYLYEINKKAEEFKAKSTFVTRENNSGENNQEKGMSGMNMDSIKRQDWFMNVMNSQDNLEFGGNEITLPMNDNNHDSLWPNMFFP